MADQAKVSSVQGFENFHRKLLLFSEESLSTLNSIQCEIHRRVNIIENELPVRWQHRLQEGKEDMREAQNILRSANTASRRLEAEDVKQRAKKKIRHAEEKLEMIKKWNKKLPAVLPQPQSRLLKAKTFILNDLDKGSQLIKRHLETLDDYTRSEKGHNS